MRLTITDKTDEDTPSDYRVHCQGRGGGQGGRGAGGLERERKIAPISFSLNYRCAKLFLYVKKNICI